MCQPCGGARGESQGSIQHSIWWWVTEIFQPGPKLDRPTNAAVCRTLPLAWLVVTSSTRINRRHKDWLKKQLRTSKKCQTIKKKKKKTTWDNEQVWSRLIQLHIKHAAHFKLLHETFVLRDNLGHLCKDTSIQTQKLCMWDLAVFTRAHCDFGTPGLMWVKYSRDIKHQRLGYENKKLN